VTAKVETPWRLAKRTNSSGVTLPSEAVVWEWRSMRDKIYWSKLGLAERAGFEPATELLAL
jgi:hypothetical protein